MFLCVFWIEYFFLLGYDLSWLGMRAWSNFWQESSILVSYNFLRPHARPFLLPIFHLDFICLQKMLGICWGDISISWIFYIRSIHQLSPKVNPTFARIVFMQQLNLKMLMKCLCLWAFSIFYRQLSRFKLSILYFRERIIGDIIRNFDQSDIGQFLDIELISIN